jgi:hypothetical protein
MQGGVICMLVAHWCWCTIWHDDAAKALLIPLHLPAFGSQRLRCYDIQQRAEWATLRTPRLYGKLPTLKAPVVHYPTLSALQE